MAYTRFTYSLSSARRDSEASRVRDLLALHGYTLDCVTSASKDDSVGLTLSKGGVKKEVRYDFLSSPDEFIAIVNKEFDKASTKAHDPLVIEHVAGDRA